MTEPPIGSNAYLRELADCLGEGTELGVTDAEICKKALRALADRRDHRSTTTLAALAGGAAGLAVSLVVRFHS